MNLVSKVTLGSVFVMELKRKADECGVSKKRVRKIEDQTLLERLDDSNLPSTSGCDQVDNVGLELMHS